MPDPCPTCKRPLRDDRYCGPCESFACRCGRMTGGLYSTCPACQLLSDRGLDPLLVVVSGSRDWTDYACVRNRLARFTRFFVIVEGGATGADQLAAEACLELGLQHREIKADWKAHGKSAGPRRNRQMLALCPSLLLAFHPDLTKSKGTRDIVTEAEKRGIPVEIIRG